MRASCVCVGVCVCAGGSSPLASVRIENGSRLDTAQSRSLFRFTSFRISAEFARWFRFCTLLHFIATSHDTIISFIKLRLHNAHGRLDGCRVLRVGVASGYLGPINGSVRSELNWFRKSVDNFSLNCNLCECAVYYLSVNTIDRCYVLRVCMPARKFILRGNDAEFFISYVHRAFFFGFCFILFCLSVRNESITSNHSNNWHIRKQKFYFLAKIPRGIHMDV